MDGEHDDPAAGSFLTVHVALVPDPELGDEACERLARRLRAEVAELDVESVQSLEGKAAPDGAKGADPVTVGALVVALSASGGVFTALIDTLRDRKSTRLNSSHVKISYAVF